MSQPDAEPLRLADCRHQEQLRVRWAEVDIQGIVFNPHHLMYLDTAVAGYWRSMALPYDALMDELGGDVFTRRSTIAYDAPARYDDILRIGLRTASFGRSTMLLRGVIQRDATRISHGELTYVYASRETGRSAPMPDVLRQWIEAFERGEPMTTVATGRWAELGSGAAALRKAVFVDEQGVPLDMELDADDEHALHAVVRNRGGMVLATGRLLPADAQGHARIGRMAVRRELRGGGLGRQVLRALMQAARERGDRAVELHAQASAIGFYAREGYAEQGARFEEAGIEHQAMLGLLQPSASARS